MLSLTSRPNVRLFAALSPTHGGYHACSATSVTTITTTPKSGFVISCAPCDLVCLPLCLRPAAFRQAARYTMCWTEKRCCKEARIRFPAELARSMSYVERGQQALWGVSAYICCCYYYCCCCCCCHSSAAVSQTPILRSHHAFACLWDSFL